MMALMSRIFKVCQWSRQQHRNSRKVGGLDLSRQEPSSKRGVCNNANAKLTQCGDDLLLQCVGNIGDASNETGGSSSVTGYADRPCWNVQHKGFQCEVPTLGVYAQTLRRVNTLVVSYSQAGRTMQLPRMLTKKAQEQRNTQ